MIRFLGRQLLSPIRATRRYLELPAAAKEEHRRDRRGVAALDPGIERAIDEGVAWLCRAQDNSTSGDDGVARHFSLITGWGSSYPETTGYIVPTMLAYAKLRGDETIRHRARRMLDWLVAVQLSDGSYQGGQIDAKPITPAVFNTGQILLGLASGVRELGDQYRQAMCRAADWLVENQDPDGCWRKNLSTFVQAGEKTYDTHVAWGLLDVARVEPEKGYADAALANVRWALKFQQPNGWFDKACPSDSSQPLTHGLGYVWRGVIEIYEFTKEEPLLKAIRKTADGLLTAIHKNGFLPGRLYPNWQGAVSWSCLTGSVQIAHCWLLTYRYTGDVRYRDAAYAANQYVRRTMKVDGPPETRGAIKASFPIYGEYNGYEYVNWASKFFIDSNLLEKAIREEDK
jgi:hypothetical protein